RFVSTVASAIAWKIMCLDTLWQDQAD
ncbi:MAG: hypothetical protein ACI8RN_000557, partial [Glaciecola sp.]